MTRMRQHDMKQIRSTVQDRKWIIQELDQYDRNQIKSTISTAGIILGRQEVDYKFARMTKISGQDRKWTISTTVWQELDGQEAKHYTDMDTRYIYINTDTSNQPGYIDTDTRNQPGYIDTDTSNQPGYIVLGNPQRMRHPRLI